MTLRPEPLRTRPGAALPGLSPLLLAILAAFPGAGGAAALARPAAPAPATVPVPARVGWLVSTSAPYSPTPTPVPVANGSGGTNLTINQASTSAVYNWQSFDIGAASSVTFNYPSASSSSLNRVTGSTAPSAIYGSLKSQYPNPDQKVGGSLVGGSIYLINANGILFGKTAQVDTGALIASTLDLQNADFYAGMSNSIASQGYTFGKFDALGDTPASLLPGADNFVLVDAGARITTASGGRVFLFANSEVQNAGSITTPNGQTVLAAGDAVYLNVPTNEPLYASEVNAAIPAVNGLLVEVGTGMGQVANLSGGVINTPTGNTTLVGMAVNQSGRINATTSVAQDGSVFLLARGNATGRLSATGGLNVKEAATGGTLTLGSGGVIAIEPDTTLDAQGQQATSNANSSFTPSLVQLSGKTIDMQSGAAIVAHGGVVDARAETTPYYVTTEDNPTRTYDYAAMTGDDARLVIAKDATIDVSGTTTTAVSAGRNFVTTALLGANDLADAPLQRSGPIYRSELTFDLRSAVPILGSTAAYTNAIEKTATEQLAAGGKIKLASTGAVVTNAASTLNVSGGVVNYSAATVAPSELLGSDGKLYTFNQAPAGLTYTAVLGAPTGLLDRWGVVPSYSPSQVSSGFVTPGYVAGQAGGTLSVVSPLAVLDGQILAGVTQGARQSAGLDPLAAASKLVLGARSNGSLAFGGEGFLSAGLVDLDINAAPGAMGDAFWSNPLDPKATLPATSRIAASTLDASGLGQLTITANGGIALNTGADLDLPTSAVVDLAAGSGGIALDADIHAAGGSVSARTRPMDGQVGIDGQGAAGALTLAAGTSIDVAATWVNRALDGATAMASTAGGAVTLSAGGALDLQDASVIDVSGAATVGTGGKVAATAAGSVTLQAGMAVPDGGAAAPVHIGAELVADSLAGGGALTLNAGSITIGAGAIASGVADGAAVGSLVLSNQFFDQGAFTSYNVNAVTSLTLAAGATLQPQASNWILSADAASMPTGSLPSSFLAVGRLADAERAPVSLQLKAASLKGSVAGDLTLAAGSSIRTDPLAAVTLSAGWNLMDAAKIVAPGGKVTLNLVGSTSQPVAGTLDLAAGAGIEVSGTTLLQPQTGALPTGQVLAGGQVTLAVSNGTNTPIVVAPGVVIAADGTSAQLGVSTTNAQGNVGTSLQTVASAGGSISIANAYGGSLAGDMHALGGDASVSGGSFALSGVDTIVVQQAPVAAVTPKAGVSAVSVSGQALSQDFADVSLQGKQQVRFVTDTDLSLAGNLLIDAPALVLAPGVASVALAGASTLLVGASYQAAPGTAGAIGGSGQLTLRGGLVELFGHQVLQGVGDAAVYAASELRLQSSTGAVGLQGGLDLQGDLTLSAPDIAPTSGSQYTINAAGQRVRVTGGDAGAALPLSAGGSLTINAADIAIGDATDATQAGVLRAPFGSITLNASDRLVVGNGSLLSVAGTGLTVPYGQTTGGTSWTYDGVAVAAPPAKLISLSAPDGAVDVAAGAKLDLSGGGNLVAQEFVPGNGGSKNIFAGAANGAFAIVPTAGAYAAQDVDILTKQPDVNGVVPRLQLGRTVTFGSGGPIPAGTYAVMPAQYATLAGAFLVTPTSASAPLALGAAIKQSDGSVLVGGRIGAAGTRFASALTQSFKVQTSAQALAYSEIDQANANAYFNAQAAAQGVAAPALPTDAGVLAIAAGQLSLKGSTLFALPTVTTTTGTTSTTTTVGRGGELDISADDIQVGGSAAAGVLALSPSDLNATGASLVVLGGQKDLSSGKVEVTADSVVIANAGTPLKVNDLVLVAKDAVTLQAGSAIEAPAASTTAAQVAAPTLNLVGDGALLRVATDASAASVRSGAQGLSGSLSIGAATTLSGGAITAEGTLTNTIAGDATLTAQAITIGAGHMAAGELGATTPGAHTLVLTSTLARQVAGAQSLTLRSATGIDLYGDVTLGGAAVRSLTLDTGSLVLIGDQSTATIEAGGVTLKNTTGHAGVASTGSGTLQVEALATTAAGGSGQVLVGPGAVAIVGASAVALSAAHEVLLGDQAALGTAGDLAISAASLQGTRAAQAALAVG